MDQVIALIASAIAGIVNIGLIASVHQRLGQLLERSLDHERRLGRLLERGDEHAHRIGNLERNQGSKVQCSQN